MEVIKNVVPFLFPGSLGRSFVILSNRIINELVRWAVSLTNESLHFIKYSLCDRFAPENMHKRIINHTNFSFDT